MEDIIFSSKKAKNRLDFLAQLLMAGLFFFVYALIFLKVMPKGISQRFMARCMTVFWPLIPCMAILLTAIFFIRNRTLKLERTKDVHLLQDTFLLWLPLSPIVQYVVLNKDILGFLDSVLLAFAFLLISLIFCIVIPLLFAASGYQKILEILGASFCFLVFSMPSLAIGFRWHLRGSLLIQIAVFLSVFIALVSLFNLNKKILAIMLVAFFFSTVAASIYRVFVERNEKSSEAEKRPSLYALSENSEMQRRPDIFLMTYDAYVENETMMQYGIDNRAQEEFLVQRGFHIYRGTYSVGADTISSMDRALEVSIIISPSGRAVSGNGAVQNALKRRGYRTYGIFNSSYMFGAQKPAYHASYPQTDDMALFSFRLIFRQILEGEFRFDAGFEKYKYNEFIASKRSILKNSGLSPMFLYAHSGPGHSQNSGRCLDNEIELFKKRLLEANTEMKEDIAAIIRHHPGALIIVNGDHGPYLTKNCTGLREITANEIDRLDIQDRYGSFLAIRWPREAQVEHEEIKILQDVFPVVFSFLFNEDRMLEARIPRIIKNPGVLPEGVSVINGIIIGGLDDGEPLFKGSDQPGELLPENAGAGE